MFSNFSLQWITEMASNHTVAVLQRIGSNDDGYARINLDCNAPEVSFSLSSFMVWVPWIYLAGVLPKFLFRSP